MKSNMSNLLRANILTKRAEKRSHDEMYEKSSDHLPEVALVAISSYKRQREVSEFINFMLEALNRNCKWLNTLVRKQNNFRCAIMTGAGPNRFQIQEVIYPNNDEDLRLKVQLSESDDHDKIALAAIMKLRTAEIDSLMKYIKNRMFEIPSLKEDLIAAKEVGINFALLSPIGNRQFRVMERIVIDTNMMQSPAELSKKRRKTEDKIVSHYHSLFSKPRTAMRH